jgi:hypothetical protein
MMVMCNRVRVYDFGLRKPSTFNSQTRICRGCVCVCGGGGGLLLLLRWVGCYQEEACCWDVWVLCHQLCLVGCEVGALPQLRWALRC